jgi:hypothetical protein
MDIQPPCMSSRYEFDRILDQTIEVLPDGTRYLVRQGEKGYVRLSPAPARPSLTALALFIFAKTGMYWNALMFWTAGYENLRFIIAASAAAVAVLIFELRGVRARYLMPAKAAVAIAIALAFAIPEGGPGDLAFSPSEHTRAFIIQLILLLGTDLALSWLLFRPPAKPLV